MSELGVEVELFSMNAKNSKFDASIFYYHVISFDEETDAESFKAETAAKFEELRMRVRRKEFKKRSMCTLKFEVVPGMEISVQMYTLVRPTEKGKYLWLEPSSNQPVKCVTEWVCEDTGTVLRPDQYVSCFEYGGKKIVFTKEDLSKVKHFLPAGITLMGFKRLSSLKPYHNIRNSSFLYPTESVVKGSSTVFASLLDRMLAMEKIAIVRIVARANSSPRFAALLPQQEVMDSEGVQVYPPGMHVIYLPYADDIREIDLEETPKAEEEHIAKAKQLVKTLRIRFDSTQFENPALQRHYAALQALALDKDELEETDDYVVPDDEGMAKFRDVIDAFEECLPKYEGKKRKAKESKEKPAKKTKEDVPFEGDWKEALTNLKSTSRKISVAQLKAKLKEMNVPFSSKAKKQELWDILKKKIVEDDD